MAILTEDSNTVIMMSAKSISIWVAVLKKNYQYWPTKNPRELHQTPTQHKSDSVVRRFSERNWSLFFRSMGELRYSNAGALWSVKQLRVSTTPKASDKREKNVIPTASVDVVLIDECSLATPSTDLAMTLNLSSWDLFFLWRHLKPRVTTSLNKPHIIKAMKLFIRQEIKVLLD